METVKASAAIRKDLKELEALKQELYDIHQAEKTVAIKKARSVRGAPSIYRDGHFEPIMPLTFHCAAESGRRGGRQSERRQAR